MDGRNKTIVKCAGVQEEVLPVWEALVASSEQTFRNWTRVYEKPTRRCAKALGERGPAASFRGGMTVDYDVEKRIEELVEYLRTQTATRGQALTITKLEEAKFWYLEYQKELKQMRERAGVSIR